MITPTFPARSIPLARKCVLLALMALPSFAVAETIQAWLLLSYNSHESLVSTDPQERETLEKGNWKLNGTVNLEYQKADGLSALHRMARAGDDSTDRVLEANPAKVAGHLKAGYHDEGVIGYVSLKKKPGMTAVLHFTKDERHLWLFDAKDQAALESDGWKSAGVSFWAWPIAAKPTEAKADAKSAETKAEPKPSAAKTDDKPTEAK